MLACLSAFVLLGAARQPDDSSGFHLVGRFDATAIGTRLRSGALYRYSEAEIAGARVPADDPGRNVLFDANSVVADWTGLQPKKRYKLRLTYLSDSDSRTQSLYAGRQLLRRNLKLPKAAKLVDVVDLPATSYAAGNLELRFEHVAGPNAVMSSVEFWSTDPHPMPGLTIDAEATGQGRLQITVRDLTGRPAVSADVSAMLGNVAAMRGKADQFGRAVLKLPATWQNAEAETATIGARSRAGSGRTLVSLDDVFQPEVHLTQLPARDRREPLDGIWRVAKVPELPFARSTIAPADWREVAVPGELAMQGVSVPSEWVAMERSFSVPRAWKGLRVKIRFDAVYSSCQVRVNDKFVGRHLGGFTPFDVDVTAAVAAGKTNSLLVLLRNDSIADVLSSGSAYAGHPLAGITRKVTLFAVPSTHIRSLHVQTPLDPRTGRATLRVLLSVIDEGSRTVSDAKASLKLVAPDGKAVPLSPGTCGFGTILAGQTAIQVVDIPVKSAQLWDCEHPNLYMLSCALTARDIDETTETTVGFRQIQVREGELQVNGKPVKLHGACRHESDPLRGRSLAPSEWLHDAELFREANVNFVRTSHYPPAEEFVEACDELGIFVEEEAPFCWCGDSSQRARGPIIRQTLEMVERDCDRPSVILWSLANESGWSRLFKESSDAVRLADPTRPQIFCYGGVDVASEHYPGPGRPAEVDGSSRPVLFDEYCHVTTYNRREVVTDPGLRDGWGLGFAAMWEKVVGSRGALGGAIWAGIDDVFLMPDGTAGGYGPWGLIDGWRRRKPEFWHVKKAYSPVRVLKTTVSPPGPNETIDIPVANRHDFTDLSEVKIDWEVGTESGMATCNAAPRGRGVVSIRPKQTELAGKQLVLRFWSPRGFLIDMEKIAIGVQHHDDPPEPQPGLRQTHEITEDAITVSGVGWKWVIDRHTGTVRNADVNGKTVLLGGPALLAVPMEAGTCAPNYSADTQPWTPACSDWKASKVAMTVTPDATVFEVDGAYKEASGSFLLTIDDAGTLTVHYRFQHPDAFWPRQIGLVFDVPRVSDTLAWRRLAPWTIYPDDHIGRPEGTARANPGIRPDVHRREQPTWPWSQDATPLGSNDFRATRRNIVWESLRASTGYGVLVRPGGSRHTRAWVDGDHIRLLVADFDNGGGDGAFGQHIEGLRKELPASAILEGTVKIELARP